MGREFGFDGVRRRGRDGCAQAGDAFRSGGAAGKEVGVHAERADAGREDPQEVDEAGGDVGNDRQEAVSAAFEPEGLAGDPGSGLVGELELEPGLGEQAAGAGKDAIRMEQQAAEVLCAKGRQAEERPGEVEEARVDAGVEEEPGPRCDGGWQGGLGREPEGTSWAGAGVGEGQEEEEAAGVDLGVASIEADTQVAAFEEGGDFGLEGAGTFAGGRGQFAVEAFEEDEAGTGFGHGDEVSVVGEFLEQEFEVSPGLAGDGVAGEIGPDPGESGGDSREAGEVGLAAAAGSGEPEVRGADERFVILDGLDLVAMEADEVGEGFEGGTLGGNGAAGRQRGRDVPGCGVGRGSCAGIDRAGRQVSIHAGCTREKSGSMHGLNRDGSMDGRGGGARPLWERLHGRVGFGRTAGCRPPALRAGAGSRRLKGRIMNMKQVMLGGAGVTVLALLAGWVVLGRGSLPVRVGKEPLPITVHFRDSLLKQGRVLVLSNATPRYLTVRVRVENPTLGSNGVFGVEVPGGAVSELGWREGWRFASGDRVRVEHADYRAIGHEVP